ncbi:MAG: hypothetical protein ACJ76N_26220 [Thermoanaerobaculia bacterium]
MKCVRGTGHGGRPPGESCIREVSGNLLRVRKLPVEEALRKYGHDDHHGEMRQSRPG